jgi:Ca2+/Na+ antiporter
MNNVLLIILSCVFVIILLDIFINIYLYFERRAYIRDNNDDETFNEDKDEFLCGYLSDIVILLFSDILIFLWIRYLFFHFNLMPGLHRFFE